MSRLILKSRSIFSAGFKGPEAGAVVINGDRISNVVVSPGVEAETQPGDRIIDCGERLIIPGFCDSHVHAYLGGIQMRSADLTGGRSESDCVRIMKEFAASGGNDSWLLGFGWNHFNWEGGGLPDRRSLDTAFGRRPVCLFNEEMHSAWVNGAGLKAAGITKDSPQPELGKIFIDAAGEPTGYLLEPEAMQPLFEHALRLSPDGERRLYRDLLGSAAACGVTSISDIDISDTLRCGIYEELLAEDLLGCRIHPVFSIKTDMDLLEQYRSRFSSDFLRFSGVKEFLDGTAPMYTGMLVEDYADRPGFNAPPLVDVDGLISRSIELDRRGIRIRFHACGAGAVRLGLDIFEKVRKRNGDSGMRHTIEHIENIHPDDIGRFRTLGVTASVQPDHLWADSYDDHPFRSLLGEERCRYAWPFRSLIESGADMAFGTDFPVSPLNPMQGIYRALSRLHEDGKPEGGWNPQEKLSLAEALTGYTAGSSRQMCTENLTGRLESGMAADIAVMDGNLFDLSDDQIRSAGVYMTVSAGRIIYGP